MIVVKHVASSPEELSSQVTRYAMDSGHVWYFSKQRKYDLYSIFFRSNFVPRKVNPDWASKDMREGTAMSGYILVIFSCFLARVSSDGSIR